jgi:hypothetical protein
MIIPFDYGQVNWILGSSGAPTGAQVTCGFDHSETDDSAQVIADNLYEAFRDQVMPVISSNLVLESALVKLGPNSDGPSAEHIEQQVGGAAASSTSPAIAVLVTKQTQFGGRTGRGRMFIPGILEGAVDSGGHIDGGTLGGWQSALDDLLSDMTEYVVPPALLHGDQHPSLSPFPITAFNVSALVATQRRRQRR